jgi:Raf kinase inhibitor-like YbhB/YbcL family protein
MKALAFSIALLAGAGLAAAASAQPAPTPQPPNLIDMPGNTGKAHLTVTSAEVKSNTLIPLDNSSWGKSISPQVSWTKGPASTKSYAVAMEDADAHLPGGPPITHWLVFNIPASATSLPASLPPQGTATAPAGMVSANNIAKKTGYFGPKTPPKSTHHYHLQVLALDETVPLTDGASRDDFAKAIAGHVVGTGEVVGLYTGPDQAPASAAAK